MSRTKEARHIERDETCKCKCRLDVGVCNNKTRWNEDKCRCKYEELIEIGICEKQFIWNPINCKCRNKLVDKLVEECSENTDENEMIYNGTLNAKLCNS